MHVQTEDTLLERDTSPRTTAIEIQQVRSLTREAEKAIAQQHTAEAERCYIQALTIRPDAYDVQAELAKLYLTTAREPKAEALYKELLQHTSDASYHGNHGLALYRQGKFEEACHAYQEALNSDPGNPDRSAALGRACIAAKRFSEAAPLLEKACSRISRDIELLHLLAECYMQLNQKPQAENIYRRINRLEPYDESVKKKLSTLAEA